MEPRDPLGRGDTVTAYDLAMEEIKTGSSRLARALLARTLKEGPMPEKECAEARRIYDKMVELYPRLRLDESQRTAFLQELAVLRARIEECVHHEVQHQKQ
jgi:hypothetical protein